MSLMPSGLLVSVYGHWSPHGQPIHAWSSSYTEDSQGSMASSVLAFTSVHRLPGQMALSVIVSLSDMVVTNFRPLLSSSRRRAKSIEPMSASPVSIIAMRVVISGACTTTNLLYRGVSDLSPPGQFSDQWSPGIAMTSPLELGVHVPMVNGPEPIGTSLTASAPSVSKAVLLSRRTVVSLMSNSLIGMPQKMSVTSGAFTV